MARRIEAGCPVIIGAGLAGLSAAIELSPAPCVVVSGGEIGVGTSTGWAQGGIAAAVGPDDDPTLHVADTLAAGAGLCDPEAVTRIVSEGPAAIAWLTEQGARFDRSDDTAGTGAGRLLLGLEGAHSRRRIVHAGDFTGAELLRAVASRARELDSVSLWDHTLATAVLVDGGRIVGVRVSTPTGPLDLMTGVAVLATGGVGGLFAHTTNPLGSRGQGLALAFRAGAVLRDLEMVQFHPTALALDSDPMPLVSEAVRGEGAVLVNELGERVLDNPLAARDVVSRAEWAQLQAGHQVFLDAQAALGERFAERFPSINATATAAGMDPSRDPLPVRPAAHYHMGGVLVDDDGASTVPGLYAVGEVASTGLHGANRLASNSLLEAVVCGRRAARHLAASGGLASGLPPALPGITRSGTRPDGEVPDDPARPDPAQPDPVVQRVRRITSRAAGVLRTGDGLRAALGELAAYRDSDAGLVAWLLVHSALTREESRGAHTRLDHPGTTEIGGHTLVDATVLANRNAA